MADGCGQTAPCAVKVRIFGREYSIKGHGDSQYVQELADFIKQRADEIQEKAAIVSTLDLAILTLLNITDEMLQCKRVKQKTINELEEKADRLLQAIDRVV